MVQIDPKIASERLAQLQARHTEILDEISLAQNSRVFDVYFEELRALGAVGGRSDNGFMVSVEGGESLLGRTLPVKIIDPKRMVLYGELVH